jgi:hypothetical protein
MKFYLTTSEGSKGIFQTTSKPPTTELGTDISKSARTFLERQAEDRCHVASHPALSGQPAIQRARLRWNTPHARVIEGGGEGLG